MKLQLLYATIFSGFIALLCFASPTTVKQLVDLRKKRVPKSQIFPYLVREGNGEGVFVGSMPFQMPQMGNRLSHYFESLACCDIIGAHYINRASVTAGDKQALKFLNSFPQVRLHPHPSHESEHELMLKWNLTCPNVVPIPHEHQGAWNQRTAMITEIMHTAVKAVFDNVFSVQIAKDTFSYVLPKDHSNRMMPLVPSAAIVFRCVDILDFVGGYGFLNFNAYKALISRNATTIYVLTEELNYVGAESLQQQHCKAIGEFLIKFLHHQFPQATVGLRRGHAVDSVAIMSNVQTFVSAPSTFSLYPGISNPNNVYVMPGGVYHDQPLLRDNFYWLTSPKLIVGARVNMSDAFALEKYKTLFTQSLEEPVAFSSKPV